MKITAEYDALLNTIMSVSSVVEDSQNAEEMKNIIFKISKEDHKLTLIGINQFITFRNELPELSYGVEVDEAEYGVSDAIYMQIKCKELVSFLNAFKSVRRTRVDHLEITIVQNKVKLEVVESDLDTGDERRSHWLFDNLPVKQGALKAISIEKPEEDAVTEESDKILMYTSMLLPIMQSGNTMYSQMVFGTDAVVAFHPSMTVLCANSLCEAFKGITLSYRAISFLKAVIGQLGGFVSIVRTKQHLVFFSDGIEAFIKYDQRVPSYEKYKERIVREHGIIFDRLYFKDVLRRLNSSDAVEFILDCQNGTLAIRNTRFEQNIPIVHAENLTELGERVSFKILPDVLEKAVIGDDAVFTGDDGVSQVSLFINPVKGGCSLIFADSSNSWFTVITTKSTNIGAGM